MPKNRYYKMFLQSVYPNTKRDEYDEYNHFGHIPKISDHRSNLFPSYFMVLNNKIEDGL